MVGDRGPGLVLGRGDVGERLLRVPDGDLLVGRPGVVNRLVHVRVVVLVECRHHEPGQADGDQRRLVLLVQVQERMYGFELRSFQEFMAAWQIVSLHQSPTDELLRALAPIETSDCSDARRIVGGSVFNRSCSRGRGSDVLPVYTRTS